MVWSSSSRTQKLHQLRRHVATFVLQVCAEDISVPHIAEQSRQPPQLVVHRDGVRFQEVGKDAQRAAHPPDRCSAAVAGGCRRRPPGAGPARRAAQRGTARAGTSTARPKPEIRSEGSEHAVELPDGATALGTGLDQEAAHGLEVVLRAGGTELDLDLAPQGKSGSRRCRPKVRAPSRSATSSTSAPSASNSGHGGPARGQGRYLGQSPGRPTLPGRCPRGPWAELERRDLLCASTREFPDGTLRGQLASYPPVRRRRVIPRARRLSVAVSPRESLEYAPRPVHPPLSGRNEPSAAYLQSRSPPRRWSLRSMWNRQRRGTGSGER